MPGAGRWTRWRARRALGGALPAGENIAAAAGLEPEGWWAITDQALYVLRGPEPVRRIARSDVRRVRTIGHASMKQVTLTLADDSTVSANIAASTGFIGELERWAQPG